MYYSEATAAIEAANLPGNIYRTARRLLDLAGENGQVKLSRDALLDICETDAEGTARRHLGVIQAAGIIHYSTNEAVHVSFVAFPTADGTRTGRAPTRATRAPTRAARAGDPSVDLTNNAPMITERAPTRAERAPTRAERAEAPIHVSQSVSIIDLSNNMTDRQYDEPETPERQPEAPSPEEQTRSCRLLTDHEVGLDAAIARQLAAAHKFEYLQRQVMTWRRQLLAGKAKSAGGLLKRIRAGWGCTVTDADRDTALWKRHNTVEQAVIDCEEDRRRRYIPDEYADIIIH